MEINQHKLSPLFTKWMIQEEQKKQNSKLSDSEKTELLSVANKLLQDAESFGFVDVLRRKEKIIAIVILCRPILRRIHGERMLVMKYDNRYRKAALLWFQKRIRLYKTKLKKNISLGLCPRDALVLESSLVKAGFGHRFFVYTGEVNLAYKNLMRAKSPPKNLRHLDLEIRVMRKKSDADDIIKIQKRVFTKIPQHGHFSHTKSTLERDLKEYRRMIKTRQGLLLGVYRGKKLLGMMGAFLNKNKSSKSGGISLILDKKIQGLGISTIGYRLLLEYMKKEKIKIFYGGTSQPAVIGLAKIMKRKIRNVLFMKFS